MEGNTRLDGIGWGAGESDQVDGVEATSSFPVESRSCSELPGTWGEGEVGGGLVQSEEGRVESQFGSRGFLNDDGKVDDDDGDDEVMK